MKKSDMCVHGECLEELRAISDSSIQAIYIDPPFNTGKIQTRAEYETSAEAGASLGEYDRSIISRIGYLDKFGNEYLEFLQPRLVEARRVLKSEGSIFIHLNYHEVHYVKVLCDHIFGRDNFIGEIIWAYDWGGYSKKRFPIKHQTILHYAKEKNCLFFDFDKVERVPYLAPNLVTKEKAEAGKPVKSVWWITIVSPTGKEKTGYPNQKPIKLMNRLLAPVVKKNEYVLDFFAGSGTTGEACRNLGVPFILVDNNPVAYEIMIRRLTK